jgi:hypothetical protein
MSHTLQRQQQQQQQKQEQEQQQQQPVARLLLELPGPALRRVLHLASTQANPATCRLSCVSKALRAAADAAAAPVDLQVIMDTFSLSQERLDLLSPEQAAAVASRGASLRTWLGRHLNHVRLLYLYSGPSSYGDGLFLDTILAPAAAAATAAAIGDSWGAGAVQSAAAAGGAATPAEPEVSMVAGHGKLGTPLVVPLRQLYLHCAKVSPALVTSLAFFKQLQALSISCPCGPSAEGADLGLVEALSQLSQLRLLHLCTAVASEQLTGDVLLRGLRPSLRALDLSVSSALRLSSSSSSGLVHLVHLTSLLLGGINIMEAPSNSGSTEQQQGAAAASESKQHHVQPAWQQARTVKALYLSGCTGLGCFIGPSLQAVDLCTSRDAARLDQLSGCACLRHLRLRYGDACPTSPGISALTQLIRLRLEAWPRAPDNSSTYPTTTTTTTTTSSSSALGRELAALGQLQLLEVCHSGLLALQPSQWLLQLRSLETLVVLVSPRGCETLEALPCLTDALVQWHSSGCGGADSSISSRSTGVIAATSSPNASSSSSSSSTTTTTNRSQAVTLGSRGLSLQGGPAAAPKLRGVELAVWRGEYHIRASWSAVLARAQSKLQPAVADMAALLPWLAVTCAEGWDAYESPSWTRNQYNWLKMQQAW